MTYSKIHQAFSKHLNDSVVFTDPEKYLGPNYQDVLNFWIYIETLSDEEKEEMGQRYWDLDDNVRNSAWVAASDAAAEVVGWGFREAAYWAAASVTGWWVFGYATYELIAHHKLLEKYKTPLALQYCTKS